jgi:muramidase (phage lysozyme)
VELDGRTVSGGYRFGFQNQEKDDEIKGEGNSVNYTFRMHDPRMGRFFNVDPLTKSFPHNSAFAFSENRVIDCGELEGLQIFYAADGTRIGQFGTSTEVRVVQNKDVEAFKKEFKNAVHSHNEFNRIKTNIENNAYSSGLSNAKMTMYRHAKVSMNFQNKILVEMSTSVGMDEDELNMRAVLGVIQKYEGSNSYYTWAGGYKFSEEDTKTGHPGLSPAGKQAAGAYQIQLGSWNDKYTGDDFRDRYNIYDFSPESQDKFTIATMKDKVTVKSYESILDGDFSTAYSKMANEWRFIEGPKSQGNVKIETLVQETRQQIAKELSGDSPVETKKGTLLNDFKK